MPCCTRLIHRPQGVACCSRGLQLKAGLPQGDLLLQDELCSRAGGGSAGCSARTPGPRPDAVSPPELSHPRHCPTCISQGTARREGPSNQTRLKLQGPQPIDQATVHLSSSETRPRKQQIRFRRSNPPSMALLGRLASANLVSRGMKVSMHRCNCSKHIAPGPEVSPQLAGSRSSPRPEMSSQLVLTRKAAPACSR